MGQLPWGWVSIACGIGAVVLALWYSNHLALNTVSVTSMRPDNSNSVRPNSESKADSGAGTTLPREFPGICRPPLAQQFHPSFGPTLGVTEVATFQWKNADADADVNANANANVKAKAKAKAKDNAKAKAKANHEALLKLGLPMRVVGSEAESWAAHGRWSPQSLAQRYTAELFPVHVQADNSHFLYRNDEFAPFPWWKEEETQKTSACL